MGADFLIDGGVTALYYYELLNTNNQQYICMSV